jgi:hypothetical protein
LSHASKLLFLCLTFVAACADDIKGEKGEPGQDASAVAAAKLRRPEYRYSSLTQIVVPANAEKSAKVVFSDAVYTNTGNSTLDVTVSGRNGLDSGSVAPGKAYYLYAIPPQSGATFDLIASLNDPGTGPADYADWSYLGAFVTNNASRLLQFVASNGRFQMNENLPALGSSNSVSPVQRTISPAPITVKMWYFRIGITGTSINSGAYISGSDGTSVTSLHTYLQANNVTNFNWGYVPALNGADVWISVGVAANTVDAAPWGWIEDPAEWP